jgi:hypothetical protein
MVAASFILMPSYEELCEAAARLPPMSGRRAGLRVRGASEFAVLRASMQSSAVAVCF